MSMLSLLPSSSLVRFEARELAAPKILWSSSAAPADFDPAAFAFCIPYPDDEQTLYTTKTKVFYGERYGGRGVGQHGGGVRCGTDGFLQVKGIGRNPLAGKYAKISKSHGGAGIPEAVREAIWGEVCASVLPYGGVKTLGIIATGGNTFGATGFQDAARALIVRQAALRPAHFMRAVNYVPSDEFFQKNCSDTLRTKHAIRQLENAFRNSYRDFANEEQGAKLLNSCFLEMARRFASQVAAARVKRIPHGALNCSNICLDGRYIDFGTQSAVPDYGRAILARGNPDLWNDHKSLIYTFNDLIFYVRNYLPNGRGTELISAEELVKYYTQYFTQRLSVEYLKLTGIPEEDLAAVGGAEKIELYRALTEIYMKGNGTPFKFWSGVEEENLPFDLNAIFIDTAWSVTAEQVDVILKDRIENHGLRRRFSTSLISMKNACFARRPVETCDAYKHFVSLNCVRLNSRIESLYRFNVDTSVDAMLRQEDFQSRISGFIDTQSATARALLSEPKDGEIGLGWLTGTDHTYCTKNSVRIHDRELAPAESHCFVATHSQPISMSGTGASACA